MSVAPRSAPRSAWCPQDRAELRQLLASACEASPGHSVGGHADEGENANTVGALAAAAPHRVKRNASVHAEHRADSTAHCIAERRRRRHAATLMLHAL